MPIKGEYHIDFSPHRFSKMPAIIEAIANINTAS